MVAEYSEAKYTILEMFTVIIIYLLKILKVCLVFLFIKY